MFQEVKETMLKELKENIVIMTQQIEILNKEIFLKVFSYVSFIVLSARPVATTLTP